MIGILNCFISLSDILNGCIVVLNYSIRFGVRMFMLRSAQLMFISAVLEKRLSRLALISLFKLCEVLGIGFLRVSLIHYEV